MKPDLELDRWIARNRSTVSRIPRHLTLSDKKSEESRRAAVGRGNNNNNNSPSAFSKLRGIVSRRTTTTTTTTTTREEYHWHHHSSPCAQHRPLAQQLMKVHHGLQMGEVEGVLASTDHWPEERGWRAVSHYRDPEHRYTADVWLMLSDFPVQLQTGIPWGPGDQEGEDVLRRPAGPGKPWHRTVFCRDRQKEPAWKAMIQVKSSDPHGLLALDLGELIVFENIYIFWLQQRLGGRSYKNVVFYADGFSYGNDLLGQNVCPWNENSHQEFESFISRLFPPKVAK